MVFNTSLSHSLALVYFNPPPPPRTRGLNQIRFKLLKKTENSEAENLRVLKAGAVGSSPAFLKENTFIKLKQISSYATCF